MRGDTGRRAFSLIELAAVIAALAILAALVVPALAGAAAAGRRAACTSNQRQMALAAQAYALEYGFYPPALRYDNDGGLTIIAWDWITTGTHEIVSPGPLWRYTDDPGEVQQCPSYGGGTNFADPHTGYNYNTTYVGGEGDYGNWGWEDFRRGVRASAVRRPAHAAMFGDGAERGNVANKFMRAPLNSEGLGPDAIYHGAQAFRHGRATVVAYVDGHVDAVTTPFAGELATDALLAAMGYPENGFLSDDDEAYAPE